jgi:hypothetical protein
MFYLFNSATSSATSKSGVKNIFLDENGAPVFVTHISKEFAGLVDVSGEKIPEGRKFAGKLKVSSAEETQLANDGNLTKLGRAYCETMGVQQDLQSLVKFITSTKKSQVDVAQLRALADPIPA